MIEAALMCLALNVYFEARNDTMVGQYAVAQVVINRVQSSKFPNDVCSVVKQSRNDGTCQFSWYCDGKSDRPREPVHLSWIQQPEKRKDITGSCQRPRKPISSDRN